MKILIVEDDPTLNEVLMEIVSKLLDQETDIYSSLTGAEGVEILTETKIDLVISDLNLGDSAVNKVLEYVQTLEDKPRFVLMSGGDFPKNIVEKHTYIESFLNKPFKLPEIKEILNL